VLSAVIMCGPPSVHLDKPVVLSFPHCASVKHGHWSLSLFTSLSAFDEPPAWHVCPSFTYLLTYLLLLQIEWWGAGVVIYLERSADLHMAQLMPLPLTVSSFSKTQIGFTFLVPAHLDSPGQKAVKRVCVCVCVYYCRLFAYGSVDATAYQTPSSFASFKSRLVLPFWYRLTRVVLEKRPLNACRSVVVVCIIPVDCFIFPFYFSLGQLQVHAFMPGCPVCIVKLLLLV